MKKLLLLLFSCCSLAAAKAQVTLQPTIAAVGMIQKNQLWNVLVVNSSNAPYDCRLELVIRDRQTGQEVMTASSGQFMLSQGARQLNESMLEPVQYNYLVSGMDSRLQGLLPAGTYTACYALNATGLKETRLAEECIQFDVEPLSPPMLIFPADSSELENAPVQFSWTPPLPAGMFGTLRYEMLLTEVKEGQKAGEALQENMPFYNDGSLYTNVMNYPSSASAMEKDKWYAWQIIARDDRNYAGKSEIWVFKIKKEVMPKQVIAGAPFMKMKPGTPELGIAPNGILKLSYFNRTIDSAVIVTVTDLSEGQRPKQIRGVRIVPGENQLQFDLKKLMSLSEESTYSAEITNSAGEKNIVLFRIKNFKDQ